MFDEPDEQPAERPIDPATRAKERFDEFRIHAEIAAVFEATRKFDAHIIPGLDAELARDVQRAMAKLEKAKVSESPIIDPKSAPDARALLKLPQTRELSTNDYHIHRRPGEVMIVRWLAGDEVDTFYERLQAHFDAALVQFREEERQSLGWKQDPPTMKYLEALEAIDVKMAERYLREPMKTHKVFILSTQTADEIDILHLCDYVMGAPAAEVVGPQSAPPDDGATEKDRAWFFKLFSLRGIDDAGVERMCFFTFMQKTDDGGW
jgi:hypothetical protein